MNDHVLRTDKLNLFYGSFHALIDVNFHAFGKSITALIGPSGCGKSTLLRCFNRMNDLIDEVKTTGGIFVNEQRIDEVDIIELRKKVGMVFQRPNPFPFSVYENMVYGLKIHGLSSRKRNEETMERCLKAVGLWDELKDRLQASALSLSEEMKQRLCIARLLTVEPEIILLDEPCSALDPIERDRAGRNECEHLDPLFGRQHHRRDQCHQINLERLRQANGQCCHAMPPARHCRASGAVRQS